MRSSLRNAPWSTLILIVVGAGCYDLTKFWIFSAFLAALVLLLFLCRPTFGKSDYMWVSLRLTSVAVLHFSEFTPSKKFYHFYAAIESDMSEKGLLAQENRYFFRGGRFGQLKKLKTSLHPPLVVLSYTVDTTVDSVTQDIIHVEMVNGKVVSKEWLAD